MGGKQKDAISKRRPRQNIIFQILKNAKKQGNSFSYHSATSASTVASSRSRDGGGAGGAGSNSREYHGSKKGILQSAVELTRRSKRATSRSRGAGGGKGRGKRVVFVKGQRAFYRSAKGIAKVTIVGVHHDAKLEPYYTIQLRDGKEKQTDGKHLTPVQEEVKEKDSKANEGSGKEDKKKEASAGAGGGGGGRPPAVSSSMISTDMMTDPLSDSEGEEEEEEEVIDYTNDGDDKDEAAASSSSDDDDDDNEGGKKFAPGQDAYYRSPDGGVHKVRILSRGGDRHPNRYNITLLDGTRRDNVKASRLATLMDLTSKELSVLMKERNKRQQQHDHGHHHHGHSRSSSGKHRSRSRSKSRPHSLSKSSAHEDSHAIDVNDEGYDAEEGEPASSGSEPSLMSQDKVPESQEDGAAAPAADGKKQEKQSFQMVQAMTEDGKTKMVPLYEAGMKVRYKNASGIQNVEILDSHLDDLMEPYYTIRLDDGREKQTDNAHLLVGEEEEEQGEEQGEGEDGSNEGEAEEGEEEKKEESNEDVSEGGGNEGDDEAVSLEKENYRQDPEEQSSHQQPPGQHLGRKKLHHSRHSDKLSASMTSSSSKHRRPTVDADGSDPSNEETSTFVKKQQDPVASNPISSSSSQAMPLTFSLGDDVLYTSSAGEHLHAVVVRLQRDKKNRPYYVVRLPEGKEKQVYGHRLKPIHAAQEDPENGGGRRARSRSRADSSRASSRAPSQSGSHRTRGRSKGVPGSGSTRDPSKGGYQRSESQDSTVMSNSSRRSRASRERSQASRDGFAGGSVASSTMRDYGRHREPASSKADRSPSVTPSESGRSSTRSSSKSAVRRIRSIANSGSSSNTDQRTDAECFRKHRSQGRERSRSRAPSADSRASSGHHQLASSAPPVSGSRSKSKSKSMRPTTPSVSMSSKTAGDRMLVDGGDEGSRLTARSITKLRSFRKTFAGMRKH